MKNPVGLSVLMGTWVNMLEERFAKIIIGAAVIDDVLGLIVLSLVSSIIITGTTPSLRETLWVLVRTLGLWITLLVCVVSFGSRIVY